MKRISVFFVLLIGAALSLGAQQLTRFAVVDLSRVYTSFLRRSQAVREFEERSKKIQAEVDRLQKDYQQTRSQYADAQARGDTETALRLETEVYRKSEFIKEYYQAKTAEIESQRAQLATSDSFLRQVMNEIRFVAESEGYTMVLNMRDSNSIVWYSPAVDITDKVIARLSK
jgi:outer membrane protein